MVRDDAVHLLHSEVAAKRQHVVIKIEKSHRDRQKIGCMH
jgi:hypothetical protein